MKDWNPDLYMQFKSERTQPSIDLIARIDRAAPESIIDIGCGPGNSTQALVNRWPNAGITGLDSSTTMIKKARRDFPDQEWIIGDLMTHKPDSKYDIVFSNAVIQWIPHHEKLLATLHAILSNDGLLAIQIPLFWDMALGQIIKLTAEEERWKAQLDGISDLLTIHDHSFYYDHLADLFDSIDMWETRYLHVLDSHTSILEMMRSTGLKPYLEKLDSDSDKNDFEKKILKKIGLAYPLQKNGKVLLPFHRLFFIGRK